MSDEDFKRSAGVQRSAFTKMPEVVGQGSRDFGRPPKLSRSDRLLLTLMRWHESRAGFHVGLARGISEAVEGRMIQKIGDALVRPEQLRLPGGNGPQPSGIKLGAIFLADVTGSRLNVLKKTAAAAFSLAGKTAGMIPVAACPAAG